MEEWEYAFDPDKNAWLIQERSISFEQIIALIEDGHLIQVLEHHDRERYPNQLLYEVDVDGYVYVVPVVREHRTLFLKTIYPKPKSHQKSRERKHTMKKKTMLDKDEDELIAAYERGAFRPVKNQERARQEAMEAARRYTRKDARINIRLSTADLEMLKRRAAEEGLPYQSLIASILHKYVSRSAPQAN
jgi:predicted DNA binding CopG/RHH family protein/uncharacterized DUF497 family protein